MKKILHLLLFFPIMVIGQTTTENYIRSKTYKVPTSTSIATPTVSQANQNITYFDGLGRPIQQIAFGQSSTGKDIVTPIEYDSFGRQVKDFLPYVPSSDANLDYKETALTQMGTFYNATAFENTLNPFSEKVLEASPLSRVLQQAAPGNPWAKANNQTIKFDYQTNTTADAVKLFSVTATWNASKQLYEIPTSLTADNYVAWQLYKTVTKDENWKIADGNNNTTEEFKDKEGRVLLKRTYNNGDKHDTYYIYDQYGNLTFVVPPLVNTSLVITQTILENLCYQYKYDKSNRLVEKKIPGKQWEYIIYDKLDRVVATGPSYSPFGTQMAGWLITKYDAFNRPIYTGWIESSVNATSRKSIQATLNNVATIIISESKTASNNIDGVTINYSNNVTIVAGTFKLLTITYYDDYNFPDAPSPIPSSVLNDNSQLVFYNNATQKPKGLVTGKWVRAIDQDNFNVFEKSYMLYDNKARVIRSFSSNYLGGYTQIDNRIDFIGKVLYTEKMHKLLPNDEPLFIRNDFTYSPQDRLITTTQIINNLPAELISSNTYDELGKIISKNVGGQDIGGATYLQKVDYTYNIRGWLTGINDVDNLDVDEANPDLFSFKISYNQVENEENYTGKELFNGNISETYWRSSSDNIKRKYGYFYDNLNRLTSSVYQKPNAAIPVQNSYNEALSYDKNGNIKRLERNGNSDDPTATLAIDALEYYYNPNSPNQLLNVIDLTPDPNGFKDGTNTENDYKYDDFGNLTKDLNKNITSITYNHLNLPTQIYFDNGNKIKYFYNAEGTKFKKVIEQSGVETTTCYLDIFQYKEYALKFFSQPEGYVNYTTSSGLSLDGSDYVPESYNYVYNYTDHLGNIRVSYSKDPSDGNIKIIEENHYYPFGLKHSNYNSNTNQFSKENGLLKIKPIPPFLRSDFNYKFNGKELQDELGLNLYDYGARNYDPATGRWINIDPYAFLYFSTSSYAFIHNSPLIKVDPDGMRIIGVTKEDAKKANEDINKIFADKRFDQFRSLISLKGKEFNKIDSEKLKTVLENSDLSTDDKHLIETTSNTINSENEHFVEYKTVDEKVSKEAFDILGAINGINSSSGVLARIYGEAGSGVTKKTKNGSFSLIIESKGGIKSMFEGANDYVDKEGNRGYNPVGRAGIFGHEVFGHGRSLSIGLGLETEQHTEAIRMENLILRVMGGGAQRDGTDHSFRKSIDNPSNLPTSK